MENYQWLPITPHDHGLVRSYGCVMPTTQQLLSSVEVARFTAHGFLRLDGVVPREMNEEALDVFAAGTLPAVREELRRTFPWYEQATARLEIHNRILLWRALSADPGFDVDHWATRITNRPAAPVSRRSTA